MYHYVVIKTEGRVDAYIRTDLLLQHLVAIRELTPHRYELALSTGKYLITNDDGYKSIISALDDLEE